MTTPTSTGHVKLLFDVERSDGKHELESVWATKEEGAFRIDNIPFYARGIACGDLVSAEPDPDGMLRFTGLLAGSGHSTLRLWFKSPGHVQRIRDELRAMGCGSELDLPRLLAVDVPPEVPYSTVKKYLDEHEHSGVLEYEEGCLGQPASGTPELGGEDPA